MNKKAFTLIELVGVVVILVLLSLLIIPIVEDKIKAAEEISYNSLIEMVETGAILYASNYEDELPELKTNNMSLIELSTILNKGLIERKSLYDKNEEYRLPLDSTIVIIKKDNNIYAKYNNDPQNNNKIFLKGPKDLKINKNSSYYEYGAYVANLSDLTVIDIGESNITNDINSSLPGTYYVSYSYTNAETLKRTVIVPDSSNSTDVVPPVITLTGNSLINISKGSSYVEQGATATDNVDGNITSRIIKTGLVNTKLKGTYYIKYNVVDLNGNKADTVVRTIIVN